jgi:hypothetical protein
MTSEMEKTTPTIVGCLLVSSGSATMKLHCIQCVSGSATMKLHYCTTTASNNGEHGFFISEAIYWSEHYPALQKNMLDSPQLVTESPFLILLKQNPLASGIHSHRFLVRKPEKNSFLLGYCFKAWQWVCACCSVIDQHDICVPLIK